MFEWLPRFLMIKKTQDACDPDFLVSAVMCCPSCNQPMKRSDRKEDWHIDPTGFAQYSCVNEECAVRPRYRRVDVLEAAREAQERSRDEKRAQEHQAFEQINEVQVRMTVWLRERYPGYFRGQFKDLAEIVKYIVSGGKEGEVSKPFQEPEPDRVLNKEDGQTYD